MPPDRMPVSEFLFVVALKTKGIERFLRQAGIRTTVGLVAGLTAETNRGMNVIGGIREALSEIFVTVNTKFWRFVTEKLGLVRRMGAMATDAAFDHVDRRMPHGLIESGSIMASHTKVADFVPEEWAKRAFVGIVAHAGAIAHGKRGMDDGAGGFTVVALVTKIRLCSGEAIRNGFSGGIRLMAHVAPFLLVGNMLENRECIRWGIFRQGRAHPRHETQKTD